MKLDNIRNIYLIGDTHLGVRNNSIEWSAIQKDFLLNHFIHKIDKDFDEDRDILVFEGDIFHYREAINVRIHNEALDIFTVLFKKFKRGVFIIIGNHDTYYKDNSVVHSLRAIGNLADNIHVFENPDILTINGRHSFLMLPWLEDLAKLNSVIADHQSFCSYIICHADIKGFKLNKWVKLEKGLEPESMKSYERVYSGHIHIRQENGNVLYTGTPYQMDRGDIGNTKGFYTLNVEGEEIVETFTRNTESPLFLKIDLLELLEMTKPAILELFDNNFIDVMANINFVNKFSVPLFLEEINGSKHRTIQFFTYSEKEKLGPQAADPEFNIEDGFNITDIFKRYLRTKDYSKDFKKQLVTKFVEIHENVKQEKSYV